MTVVTITETGGLGEIEVTVAAGGGAITPASRIVLETIGRHRHLLAGTGLDWGSGTGCLAIACARVDAVERVVAVEKDPLAVASIDANARRNGVGDRVVAVQADVLRPLASESATVLEGIRGSVRFVVANPPFSKGDDGLGYRRRLLAEAHSYLVPGAPVLLQISAQYGWRRIDALAAHGYRYEGMLETSPLVPFDLEREDLRVAVAQYVAEEERTGEPYDFRRPGSDRPVSARDAVRTWRATGESPLSRWQVHLLTRA